MGVEGRIEISLGCHGGQVDQVQIQSTRPLYASRLLEGKSVEQALQWLPRLFAICGTAQSCAGVRACEQALGLRPASRDEERRDCLVNMETVTEHLWRILLDWPVLLGEQPEQQCMASMLTTQQAYRLAVMATDNPFLLSGAFAESDIHLPLPVLQKLGLILQQQVYGMPAGEWLALSGPNELQQWASSGVTVAARLLRRIEERQWCGLGRCTVAALPVLKLAQLHCSFEQDDFIGQPQWLGDCCETSVLTRTESPLLRALKSLHGNGLLVRLVARLTELAQLAGRLFPERFSNASLASGPARNPAIGQVSAARGQLIHRVDMDGEQISCYQILAPTEWNFHPRGVVARSLARLTGNMKQLEQQAKLLINAIDPCVGFSLNISGAF